MVKLRSIIWAMPALCAGPGHPLLHGS